MDSMLSIEKILKAGVEKKATTIYFIPGSNISLRVGEKLLQINNTMLDFVKTREIAEKLLPESVDRDSFFENLKSYNFAYSLKGVGRFRIHIFKQRGSIAIVVRIIPMKIPPLENLGLSRDFFEELSDLKGGLFIINGKTRSGKSTIMASIVDYINRKQNKIIVILEPTIQYTHKNIYSLISQREMISDFSDFESGIDDAFYEDQDIIVVDEVMDGRTFMKIIEALLKGITTFIVVSVSGIEDCLNYLINSVEESYKIDVINELLVSLKGIITTEMISEGDMRKVKVGYTPGSIVNTFLLNKKTNIEQKMGIKSKSDTFDSTSSVNENWYDE